MTMARTNPAVIVPATVFNGFIGIAPGILEIYAALPVIPEGAVDLQSLVFNHERIIVVEVDCNILVGIFLSKYGGLSKS